MHEEVSMAAATTHMAATRRQGGVLGQFLFTLRIRPFFKMNGAVLIDVEHRHETCVSTEA